MRISIFIVLFFICYSLVGQEIKPSVSHISKHINYLASDKMKGRGTGSKESIKAARYIAKQFKKMNLAPLGTDGFLQSFTAKVRRVVVPDSVRQANNVIGFLDNGAIYTCNRCTLRSFRSRNTG